MEELRELIKDHTAFVALAGAILTFFGIAAKSFFDFLTKRDDNDTAEEKVAKESELNLVKELRDAWEKDRQEWNVERTSFAKERADCLLEIKNLRVELDVMANRVRALESALPEAPFPEWQLSADFRFVYCNIAFERKFLTPKGLTREWLRGKKVADVWDGTLAAAFEEIDKRIASAGIASLRDVLCTDGRRVSIYKWSERNWASVIVTMRGMMIPDQL